MFWRAPGRESSHSLSHPESGRRALRRAVPRCRRLIAQRQTPGDLRPFSGRRLDGHRATDRADVVAHVDEARAEPFRALCRSKPAPSSVTSKNNVPSRSWTRTIALAPSPACLPAFCNASTQQK